MKKIIPILIYIFFSFQVSNATDTLSLKYMPLSLGNLWVYHGHMQSNYGVWDWTEKYSVVFSRYVNDHIYYYLNSDNLNLFKGYYRMDSTTGSLYRYDSTGSCPNYHNEKLVDSLSAINGDTVKNCGSSSFICSGTTNVLIFDDSTSRKSFEYTYSGPTSYAYYNKRFAYKYGKSYYYNESGGSGHYGSYKLELKGCKINGIVYGDTITTEINQIRYEIPVSIKLFQNYPNPFNPTTTIKFAIPKSSNVKITIYDITGKELEVLVNEKLQAGTYQTSWNASNFSSGVYFYGLIAGDFKQYKSMLYIK